MPQQIQVPGQGIVEFPDSMNDEQIVAAINKLSTPAPKEDTIGNPDANIRKFLNFISKAEGHGYNTITGGGTFSDFSKHPGVVGLVTKEGPSTAAGAYGITKRTYDSAAPGLGITDFSETSQDKIAIELIRRRGALGDVAQGNWEAAINKLGAEWASLPSSPYNQPKRSWEWALSTLNGKPTAPGYQAFAPVRQKIDIKSLNMDEDFLRASALMYQLFERKPFEGTQDDLAEYGKNGIWGTLNDMVLLGVNTHAIVTSGTPEQQSAFLYLVDTFENTDPSLEGVGRSLYHNITDPTNIIGIGTLGVATAGKFLGREAAITAAKASVREALIKSLARTGIAAGIDAGIAGAATSTTIQGVEIAAGRRKEYDLAKIGADTAISAAAGAVLGTAADAAASKIMRIIRGEAADAGKKVVDIVPPAKEEAPGGSVVSSAEKKADELINPKPVEEGTTELWHTSPYKFDNFDFSKVGKGEGSTSFVFGLYFSESKAVSGPGGEYSKTLLEHPAAKESGGPHVYRAQVSTKTLEQMLDLDKPLSQQSAEVKAIFANSALSPDATGREAYEFLKKTVGHDNKNPAAAASSYLQKNGVPGLRYLDGDSRAVGEGTRNVVLFRGSEKLLTTTERLAKDAEAAASRSSSAPISGTRDPNLGSTLTPSEIAAATERKQKGRLPEDNVVPDLSGRPDVHMDLPDNNTGLRSTARNMVDVTRQGDELATQLRSFDQSTLEVALEKLRNAPFEDPKQATREAFAIIDRGIQIHADEVRVAYKELLKAIETVKDPARYSELSQKLSALEERMIMLDKADDAAGSMAGSLLRQRQEGLPGVTGVTVESIMKEQNLSKADAQKVWSDLVTKAEQTAEVQKVASEYDSRITQADSLPEKARLAVQKMREMAAMGEAIAPGSASFIQKLTEFTISNVFSLKTILVNLIPSGLKTLIIPGLKLAVTNPFDRVARIEAMASYSSMRSSFWGALQGSSVGYRYEQALLTRDGTRLVEGELALTGKLGGAIRTLPRILNASDEFLSRINYDSFIAGRAAGEAATKAIEAGKTGKALNEAVDNAVKAALRNSREISKGEELVQPIINKGVNLGLTGEALWKWVEREAMRNPEALRKGTDEEALNFVRDVLYKRKFSGGEGKYESSGFLGKLYDKFSKGASQGAIQYEETMKKFPTLKLVVGQLFFRTPVRVFEEGVRLTPGLQLIAPNFVSDLAGKNGTLRQVRAQAEAMSSLAIAGAVLSLYGQGKITGDGAYSDWKQQRTREDGPLPPSYSIIFSDGSTWSYRNFDPLATPMKIIINGLERMDRLHLRESQGELIDKSEFDKAMAYVTVGTTAVAAAIKDANLTEGVNQLYKFGQNLADPEQNEAAFLKLMGDRLQTLVPNTLKKIAQDNDPTIKDPVTFWQVVEEKLLRPFGRDDVKTPFSYDVLGNSRKLADTGSLWNVFSTATVEERARGMSEQGQFVMQELDRLSRVTGATFKAPIKHSELGDLDLRTLLAKDGKSTLYDVWQKNYKELNPDKILYPILKEPMPDGTFKFKAARVELVQATIKDLQDAAFYKTMAQEKQVIDHYIEKTIYEQKAKAGLYDRRAY